MSLTYPQMQQLLAEIQPLIEGAICEAIECISKYTGILKFKQPATNQPSDLLFNLNPDFLRFHLTYKTPSQIIHNPFSKTLDKIIRGKKTSSIKLLQEDRILAIQFSDATQLIIEFFSRKPNCYLIDPNSQILTSWFPTKKTTYQPPINKKNTPEIIAANEIINSRSIETTYLKRELEDSFLQQKQIALTYLKSLINRSEKILQQRKLTLEQCQQWQKTHHQGILLQSQLFHLHKGISELTVDDWENENKPKIIPLDPLLEPHLQAEAFFKRSRKLRLGEPHAERMLQQAKHEINKQHLQLLNLEKITTTEALQTFCKTHGIPTALKDSSTKIPPPKKPPPAKPYHIYTLSGGLHAWVGKSAKDNDKLSFQHANGSDWWLHISDYPGSHIVVRCPKDKNLEGESLKDAVELALRFSKAKGMKDGDATLTQVKYLKRIKGTPGKVQLSKHKVIHHSLDEKRWQRLKNSKNLISNN